MNRARRKRRSSIRATVRGTVPHDPSLTLEPIGYVSSPYRERHGAPRQPAAARGVAGTITLLDRTGYEHALEDVASWSHLWVIYWFDRNATFKPKVAPPRSTIKRGVFATRAPYRPNPLGLSLLRLVNVEGRVLHVRDVDMLDGTPVLDIKPYVPYADVAPDANDGWLTAPNDPAERYQVSFAPRAEEQLRWLQDAGVTWLRDHARQSLSLGPAPHPYRRIKREGDHLRIAVKDFRMRFSTAGFKITVQSVHSGYPARALEQPHSRAKGPTPLGVHRQFVALFG